ncbi:LacI family DNA-binding transcriptional regulator [Thalassobacillus hwangdonensis]|uniref:LacI family DNA-binding transcriptional regulator n=1 Tax=Thalassobacillus hwangdonensis TaxID=546108 RepID=A0ABW3L1G6_9BACI
MPNIRDLAIHAKVSVSTVSRVLNGHPYVKEEKREAVWQAVEALNYQQNINAVHLSKGKTEVIGVILPYINHPYFGRLLEGIADEAEVCGYKLMLIQTNYERDKELEALDMLRLKQVDGLIFTSRTIEWEALMEYRGYGPIVACENKHDSSISTVFIDHYEAFKEAMEFLIEKGHQKIGYCIGRREGSNSRRRHQAYVDVMKGAGIAFDEGWIFDHCLYMDDGERVVKEWRKLASAPTALLVTNDVVAAGITLEAQRRGVKIPGDLAVVGFDNQPLAKTLDLTTVELPLYIIGKEAFRISIGNGEVAHVEKPFRLIRRNTV